MDALGRLQATLSGLLVAGIVIGAAIREPVHRRRARCRRRRAACSPSLLRAADPAGADRARPRASASRVGRTPAPASLFPFTLSGSSSSTTGSLASPASRRLRDDHLAGAGLAFEARAEIDGVAGRPCSRAPPAPAPRRGAASPELTPTRNRGQPGCASAIRGASPWNSRPLAPRAARASGPRKTTMSASPMVCTSSPTVVPGEPAPRPGSRRPASPASRAGGVRSAKVVKPCRSAKRTLTSSRWPRVCSS